MSVSVVIPTLNPGSQLRLLLERLLAQTVNPEVLVVDSSSDDATARIATNFTGRIRFETIAREAFDHGGTRDWAFRKTSGDIVCFFTQDALPTDTRCLEKLCLAFTDSTVAAAFGRQIARREAPVYERLIREFNYPDQSRVWSEADRSKLGVKAYFFSNAFAAYRRDSYLATGGFEHPLASNEDMLMAASLLHAGYTLAYVSDATVFHSHNSTLQYDFHRYRIAGSVMQAHRDQLADANAKAEGLRMVSAVCAGLTQMGHASQIPVFLAHAGTRFLGNKTGSLQARCKGSASLSLSPA